MDFTLILPIIAYLGLVCGIFLVYCNRDEIKQARKYLLFSQKVVIALAILLTAYFFRPCCGAVFIAIFLAILLFIARKRIPSWIVYPVLGLFVYFSTKLPEAFLTMLALTFLYGLPAGTLAMFENKYNKKKVMVEIAKNLGFFICIILILLPIF
jgi:hypothetical protein